MRADDDNDLARPSVSAPDAGTSAQRKGATRSLTHEQRTQRDALARNLCARISSDAASYDELRVVDVIFGRLEKGREDYGPLELDGDPRNWRDEAAEELVDLAIYDACDRIARRDEQLARLRCEAADELAAKIGDDHTLETYRNKFSNFIPYGNAPDPRDNPFCDHEPVTSPHERFDLGGES